METNRETGSRESRPASCLLPDIFATAVRFWELRRLACNLVLASFALLWLIATWPHFRPAMTLIPLLQLIVLALIANLFYCAAYAPELFVLNLTQGPVSTRWRNLLWVLGTVLAVLLENYWIADEIYPFVC